MATPSPARAVATAGAMALGLAIAGTAAAAPSCTSLTPAAGDTVTCTYSSAGVAAITIPQGTSTLSVVVTGGGGGGGGARPDYMGPGLLSGSAGGVGAKVEASLNPLALTTLAVGVGRGGLGDTGGTGAATAGGGGGHSAVYAGSTAVWSQAVAIAGGGGGGAKYDAGQGGAGAAAGTAAGGDGTTPVGSPTLRGRGGAGGTGGAGVPTCVTGATTAGENWALGGAGGTTASRGGAGGSGYGGGGGSCDAGGGAGGSMVDDAYRVGVVTYSPAGGAGGTAGTASSTNGGSGGNGQVRITFVAMTYALTYLPNGATGGSVPINSGATWNHGAAVTLAGNTGGLERPGYTFAGWNTAADGSGTAYAPGTTATMLAALALHAQWVPVPAPSTAVPGAEQATNAPAAAPAPADTARRQVLAGRFSLANGVGAITGTVPPGASSIIQTARTGGSAVTQGFLEMAKARTAKGKCRITTVRNKKTKKVTKRTYKCTIKLSKGTWTVTTTARGTAGVVAQSTRRVVVK